ncbi:hypothetical protein ACQKMW_28395, partial [Pseudomonas sivasensis]|uniref:hypothetical protein n=1 Tax=Pseudomonas sivasensis TaxID=1880678 RepID=UPI003CFDDC65
GTDWREQLSKLAPITLDEVRIEEGKINSDELVAAFEFLNQFKNQDEKIEKLLEWIVSKKWDFLSDREKEGFNSCFSTNDLSYR